MVALLPTRSSTFGVPWLAAMLAVVLSVAGTLRVEPGVPPWPRVWASVFFILLIWPVGLWLLGRLAGFRAQIGAAALLLLGTAGQALHLGSLPLPLVVRWSVTLEAPGDAIRQRIVLPAPDDPAWRRAWQDASRVVLAVCTEGVLPDTAGVVAEVDAGPPQSLAAFPRIGKPAEPGWYYLPVSRAQVEASRELVTVVRREQAAGGPSAVCGGQDDPRRPGAGGAARWLNGAWRTDQLADVPIPPLGGQVPLQRYYVELRFLDQDGLPHVAIWY